MAKLRLFGRTMKKHHVAIGIIGLAIAAFATRRYWLPRLHPMYHAFPTISGVNPQNYLSDPEAANPSGTGAQLQVIGGQPVQYTPYNRPDIMGGGGGTWVPHGFIGGGTGTWGQGGYIDPTTYGGGLALNNLYGSQFLAQGGMYPAYGAGYGGGFGGFSPFYGGGGYTPGGDPSQSGYVDPTALMYDLYGAPFYAPPNARVDNPFGGVPGVWATGVQYPITPYGMGGDPFGVGTHTSGALIDDPPLVSGPGIAIGTGAGSYIGY